MHHGGAFAHHPTTFSHSTTTSTHHQSTAVVFLPSQLEESPGIVRLNFSGAFCPSFPPSLDGVISREVYLGQILPRLKQLESDLYAHAAANTGSQVCTMLAIPFLWISFVGMPLAIALLCWQQNKAIKLANEAQEMINTFMEQIAASLTNEYQASHGLKFYHIINNNIHALEIRFTPSIAPPPPPQAAVFSQQQSMPYAPPQSMLYSPAQQISYAPGEAPPPAMPGAIVHF